MLARDIGFNQLDRMIGMKPGYTSGLVNPRKGHKPRDPKGATLLALAIHLDTTEAWLLSGAPDSKPPHRKQSEAGPKSDLVYEADNRLSNNLAEAIRQRGSGWSAKTVTDLTHQAYDSKEDPPVAVWLQRGDTIEHGGALHGPTLDDDPVGAKKAKRPQKK